MFYRSVGSDQWAVVFALLFFCSTSAASSPNPQLEKAISLAVAAEYRLALDIFQELLKPAPHDPLLNYYAGITSLRLNRIEHAIFYLEKSVQEKAPFPQAYIWLSEAYLERNMKDKARSAAEKGLHSFPRNRPLQRMLKKIGENSS